MNKEVCGPDDGATNACMSKGLLVLRLTTGVIFIMAGYSKIFGALGVAGFAASLGEMGVPAATLMAWVVALVELLGGIALIAGIYTRVFASLLAIVMLVAFGIASKGFDVIALFGSTVALALTGPGKWAVMKGRCRPCHKDSGSSAPAAN